MTEAGGLFAFIVDIYQKGGIVVVLLTALALWALVIIVLKARHLRRDRIISPAVVQQVEQLLLAGKLAEATAYCKQTSVPMTRIILAGVLNYDREEAELKERLEEAGRQEVPGIRRHLTELRTIASVAPLLGLFGTVIGMISVFDTLAQGETIRATDLAGGISQALITTAVGLVVAMPAMAFYNDFSNRVTTLIIEMERIALRMAAILKRAG